jgi:transmembrane sensor
MTTSRFILLLGKYKDSLLTPQEETEFNRAVDSHEFDSLMQEDFDSILDSKEVHPLWTAKLKEETFQNIKVLKKRPFVSSPLKWYKQTWTRYAAAILIFIGISMYLWLKSDTKSRTEERSLVANTDILPGSNRATLLLSNGKQIILDSSGKGKIAHDGNADVIKLEDDRIIYNANGSDLKEIAYNTMSTPRGGQYQLRLPDGTKVWLNAASSIRYPTIFTGKQRNVVITGEVFLEVAKDEKHPFIVTLPNKSEILVLGTQFNVNTYSDELESKTTLFEGSVKVFSGLPGRWSTLKPGQQAKLKDQKIEITDKVDIDQVIAWKNGKFNFEDADLETVLRQLSRWYDVQIEYNSSISNRRFGGGMDRSLTLSQVLKILKRAGIKFEIRDRKLIVSA